MLGLTKAFSPIGLDVGTRAIKAVQFRLDRAGRHALHAAAVIDRDPPPPVPTGALPPAPTPDEMHRAAAALWRQGFHGAGVVACVPKARVLTGTLELPPRSSGAPLGTIARAELARAHKAAPEEIEAGWWELPAGARAVEETYGMAIGCRHADAHPLLDVLEEAGLIVHALDAPGPAAARAAQAELGGPSSHAGTLAVLDLGWSSALLVLIHAGVIVYERILEDAAWCTLHARLRDVLGADAEAADYILRSVGFSAAAPDPADTVAAERRQPGFEAAVESTAGVLDEHLSRIASEVSAALAYVARRFAPAQPPHPEQPGVLLMGGGAAMPGLRTNLARRLERSAAVFGDRSGGLMPHIPTHALPPGQGVPAALGCATGLALHQPEAVRSAA